MLNQEQFQVKWNEIKGGIRNLWGRISDDELEQFKGNITKVTELVEERYDETKDEIKSKLDRLLDSFDNDTDKNISLDRTSFERSPIEERTSAQSQIEDEVADYTTRSAERSEFENKTFSASHEEVEDPQHHSNYSGANPGRERYGEAAKQTKKEYSSEEIYEEEVKSRPAPRPGTFRPGSFDRSDKNARH